jgi:hypothetical protein
MPRYPDGKPFVPASMPAYDDEELGFSFFRSGLEDGELSGIGRCHYNTWLGYVQKPSGFMFGDES